MIRRAIEESCKRRKKYKKYTKYCKNEEIDFCKLSMKLQNNEIKNNEIKIYSKFLRKSQYQQTYY